MILLIDNSNTRTKFSLGDAQGLSQWQSIIPTAELTVEKIRAAVQDQTFSSIALCSVVPTAAQTIIAAFPETPLHQITHRSHLPIEIDYPVPEQIGADRLANASAIFKSHGSPAIVLDFGTALTFDILSEKATYIGGVIAPGMATMCEGLSQRTALLPKIELSEPTTAIGKSTSEAMQIGAVTGYRGLVVGILDAISKEMKTSPQVVATGGDAALICAAIPTIDEVLPKLTLEGIRQIALLNPLA